MDNQTPTPIVSKTDPNAKKSKSKKWVKRTITGTVCGVIMGVGFAGVYISTTRHEWYLKSITLIKDADFNCEYVAGQAGNSGKSLRISWLFQGDNPKPDGYSVEWSLVPYISDGMIPKWLSIETQANDENGWLKWTDENQLAPTPFVFFIEAVALAPGGVPAGDKNPILDMHLITLIRDDE